MHFNEICLLTLYFPRARDSTSSDLKLGHGPPSQNWLCPVILLDWYDSDLSCFLRMLLFYGIIDLKTTWREIYIRYYEGNRISMSRFKSSSARISGNSLPVVCLLAWFKGRPLSCSHKGSLVHDEISPKKIIKFYPFPIICLKDTLWKV